MSLRNYNIYFHTHTISGIIITAVLYVIFFAGSFSFFKQEITNWQKDTPGAMKVSLNYDQVIDSVSKKYNLYGREVSLYSRPHSTTVGVYLSESKDTVNNKGEGVFFILTREPLLQKIMKQPTIWEISCTGYTFLRRYPTR